MLEATTYTRVCRQQQLGKCWCVVAGVSSENLKYIHIKYFCMLSVYENIFTAIKERITVFGLKVIM